MTRRSRKGKRALTESRPLRSPMALSAGVSICRARPLVSLKDREVSKPVAHLLIGRVFNDAKWEFAGGCNECKATSRQRWSDSRHVHLPQAGRRSMLTPLSSIVTSQCGPCIVEWSIHCPITDEKLDEEHIGRLGSMPNDDTEECVVGVGFFSGSQSGSLSCHRDPEVLKGACKWESPATLIWA